MKMFMSILMAACLCISPLVPALAVEQETGPAVQAEAYGEETETQDESGYFTDVPMEEEDGTEAVRDEDVSGQNEPDTEDGPSETEESAVEIGASAETGEDTVPEQEETELPAVEDNEGGQTKEEEYDETTAVPAVTEEEQQDYTLDNPSAEKASESLFEEPVVEEVQKTAGDAVSSFTLKSTKNGLQCYDSRGTLLKKKWKTLDGKKYYFGADGYAKTGWFNVGSGLYYAAANGVVRSGFAKIGGKKYYLPADGNTRTGWTRISGKSYYLGSKGLVNTGFKAINGMTYYFMDSRCTGYTSALDGVLLGGFRTISGNKYYFYDKNASACSDKNRNSMAKGWVTISGERYHFESSGVATKGWSTLSGKKYFFASTGRMYKGVTKISGKYYCLSGNGQLLTGEGFKTVNGKKHYTNKNGVCVSGFKKIDGKGYCLASDGQLMKNGLKKIGNALYVVDKDGVCRTGWFVDNGYLYVADAGTCRIDENFIGDYTKLSGLTKEQRSAALQIIKAVYKKYREKTAGRVFIEYNKTDTGTVVTYEAIRYTYRIALKQKFSRTQLSNILSAVSNVYTGNFITGPEFKYSQDKNNVLTLEDDVNAGAADLYRMSAIYSFAKLANRECLKKGMTDREKVAAINAYLCRRFTYRNDFDARRSDEQHGIKYALESGYASSEYATFFYAMCGEAGIECERLEGKFNKSCIDGLSSTKMQDTSYARNSSTLYGAWNRVRLEGKWYYIDCAANDAGTTSNDRYFLKTKLDGHTKGEYNCLFEDYFSDFY